MADIFSQSKRSEIMSRIRGRGNKDTELVLAELLRRHRITGWRRGVILLGKPDFVFRRERVAVFVDGCFWHRHPNCKYAYTPKSRLDFWLPKFERNVARDREVMGGLRQSGWKVVRVWECELAKKTNWSRIANRIKRKLSLKSDCRKGASLNGRKGRRAVELANRIDPRRHN